MKFKRDSEIKARFALAVLRVAQSAEREAAVRLVQGLARDLPHPDEQREVAALHFDAINAFEKLTVGLQGSAVTRHLWEAAISSASKWLGAVERN